MCPNEWRKIETAPKDGRSIIGAFPRRSGHDTPYSPSNGFFVSIAAYYPGGWVDEAAVDAELKCLPPEQRPLFWMPLPAPPTGSEREK